MKTARRWWGMFWTNVVLCTWNAVVLHDGQVLFGTMAIFVVLSFVPWRDAPERDTVETSLLPSGYEGRAVNGRDWVALTNFQYSQFKDDPRWIVRKIEAREFDDDGPDRFIDDPDRLFQLRGDFRHLLAKCIDARRGGRDAWAPMSTGEKAAVALVLNKPEWLAEMSCSIVEALERIGPEWRELLTPAHFAIVRLEISGAFGDEPLLPSSTWGMKL